MFKKSMAALAVLSLSAGLASASEVTLYGIVDNGLLYKHSNPKSRTGWLYNQPAPYFLRLAAR